MKSVDSSRQQLEMLIFLLPVQWWKMPMFTTFFLNIDWNFSHGLDIHYGDGSKYLHPLPKAQVDKANEVKKELNDICQDGAWIEDKGSSCTFHYRY